MTGQDPATATADDVATAIARRLRLGGDPLEAAMSIIRPVLADRDAALERERRRVAAIYGWRRSHRHQGDGPPEAELDAYAEVSRLQELLSSLIEELTGGHRAQEDALRRKFQP